MVCKSTYCIWYLILPSQLKDCATYTGSSRSVRSRSPGSERDDRGRDRKGHKDDARDESRRGRDRHSIDREERYRGREARGRYEQEYDGDYGRKRSRYEGSRRTPGMQFLFLLLSNAFPLWKPTTKDNKTKQNDTRYKLSKTLQPSLSTNISLPYIKTIRISWNCFQDQHFDMFKNFYIPVYGIVICHVLVMQTPTIYFEE